MKFLLQPDESYFDDRESAGILHCSRCVTNREFVVVQGTGVDDPDIECMSCGFKYVKIQKMKNGRRVLEHQVPKAVRLAALRRYVKERNASLRSAGYSINEIDDEVLSGEIDDDG